MFDPLTDVTSEKTKSKTIDRAVDHYRKCAGASAAHPTGTYEELMNQAVEQGSLTPGQIVEILHTENLPVQHTQESYIGEDK